MMNRRLMTKLTAIFLALLTAFTMTIVVFADEAQNGTPAVEEILPSSVSKEGYVSYRENRAADLKEKILLVPSSATLEQASLEGDRLAVSSGGSVTFSFDLTEAAAFEIVLDYEPLAEHRKDDEIALLLDGEIPFAEAEKLILSRLWKDATAIVQDNKGNDLIPEQEEIIQRREIVLRDDNLFVGENLIFSLEAGSHTLTLQAVNDGFYLYGVTLKPVDLLPTASELAAEQAGLQAPGNVLLKQQAEVTLNKTSQSVYPQYDRSTPATEPYHVSLIRRNVLGKDSWSTRGDEVTWQISDVPADGLYYITLKYRQNEKIGGRVYRSLKVNGTIPCLELSEIAFDYDVSWQNMTLATQTGEKIAVYLKEGENTITMTAVLGSHEEACLNVQKASEILSQLYIQMVMICGSSPDTFRDYHLDDEIPGLLESMEEAAEMIEKASSEFVDEKGKKTSETASLDRAVDQLRDMIKNPDTIPTRISNFRDTISTLSDWLYTAGEQPLTLDYLLVHSADAEIPSPRATFWESLVHQINTFFASFVEDYDNVSATEGGEETITVWANTGRDQVQLMWDMVRDDFTPETDISVQLSLVQTGFIEATLAGAGPDIAIGIARGQPVNLACRGVLTDLTQFEDFKEVAARFSETACVPYTFDNGVYALPNTQSFFMMFYRTDVLESLNIAVPQTWDEVKATISRLQKKNMTFGLPYTVISAAAAVDLGMGAKDMYSMLLLQNGGSYYNPTATATTLDNEIGVDAFTDWCSYYTDYGFDLVYDFYTRFRYGEMPIGIATFEMYNTLITAAPEIRGLWEMAPVPGTKQTDGSINRATGGAGSGIVMFNTAKSPKACWEFLKWWTEAGTQSQYGIRVENILGPAGRYSTANLEGFAKLPWSESELTLLEGQRAWVEEIPEIPGSYFVSRCLDNAFRAVIYDSENPQESFAKEIDNINREITRKRKELGLPVLESED